MNNYYEILGVDKNATVMQVKKAYFTMVRKYPPERYPEKFMEIRTAYETLSNEETRKEYDSLVDLPEIIRLNFEHVQELIENGNLKRAITQLEKMNSYYPDLSMIESLLGEAYIKNNNTGKAIKIFEELVKKHPENASFSGHLAHSYLDRGWHKKAIEAYKRAIELDKDNISFWLKLSEAYIINGEIPRVKAILYEALETHGGDRPDIAIGVYFNLFMIDIRQCKFDNLKENLEALTKLTLEYGDERDAIGWVLYSIAQNMIEAQIFDPAMEIIECAEKLTPDSMELAELKRNMNMTLEIDAEIERFNDDKRYVVEFIGFVETMVLPRETLGENEVEIEFTCRAGEKQFLEKFFMHKKNIIMLKNDYPGIYERVEDYFKKVENPKERKRRIRECNQYIDKQGGLMQRILGSMPMEDYDDDDDDDEDSSYYEIQDPYIREEPKIGRNDPCPCGSGKKYKKCCGK